MGKKNIMISVDEYIHRKAKESGLNISGECEMALKIKSGQKLTEEDKQCKLCGSKENLMWKDPEWFWCCEKCINEEIRVFTARICCAKR